MLQLVNVNEKRKISIAFAHELHILSVYVCATLSIVLCLSRQPDHFSVVTENFLPFFFFNPFEYIYTCMYVQNRMYHIGYLRINNPNTRVHNADSVNVYTIMRDLRIKESNKHPTKCLSKCF